MTLFYCVACGTVSAFDLKQIAKHDLVPVEERDCPVCNCAVRVPLETE